MKHSEFVFRINGSAGRCRLVFPLETATFGDVRRSCSEKFSVPCDEIALSLDKAGAQRLVGDSKRLKDLQLPNGVQLYMHSQTLPVMVTTGGDAQTSHQTRKGEGPHMSSSSMNTQGHSPQEQNAHKFRPFEAYINSLDFQITDLPLMNDYRPVKKNPVGATKLPPTISLKHQAYRHIDHLEVMNVAEVSNFVRHWHHELEMLQQRAAYLIGYYKEDPHYEGVGMKAVVEAIYEPPQLCSVDSVTLQDDPFLPVVEDVAKHLGLEVIGWTFTHLPREKLITATEVMAMGRLQLARLHLQRHYTNYPISTFVTMTISPKDNLKGEAGPDAFMLSDLGLAMIRDEVIVGSGDTADDTLVIRSPRKGELMPTILEEAQSTRKLDTDWLLIRVVDSAPKEIRSIFKRTSFPRMGRTEATLADIRFFLGEASAATQPHERYADFHFILFVAKVLGLDSAKAICDTIKNKTELEAGFEDILTSLA